MKQMHRATHMMTEIGIVDNRDTAQILFAITKLQKRLLDVHTKIVTFEDWIDLKQEYMEDKRKLHIQHTCLRNALAYRIDVLTAV